MNEIDILAATYDHTCKVYRAQMVDLPNGETTYQDGINGQLVYENLPCALSSPSGGKLSYKSAGYPDKHRLSIIHPSGHRNHGK